MQNGEWRMENGELTSGMGLRVKKVVLLGWLGDVLSGCFDGAFKVEDVCFDFGGDKFGDVVGF